MDFIDETRIYVKAGDGGKGCVSFRREKYVPHGGPDGGDGGRGGDVIFVANNQLSTLLDFKYQQHYTAESGRPGGGSQKTGRSAQDMIVQVPVGTVLKNEDTGEILRDMAVNGEQYVLAKGGRGGRGNLAFVSSTNQAPRQYDEGELGEELTVRMILKLLADVAIVGFPNAGKSTLLSVVSSAKPKIAAYPFTTLVPQLGVVELGKEAPGYVVADIPGLIEGAHTGRGLGIRFLKHLERSRLLWILVDVSSEDPPPIQAYETLLAELSAYQPALAERPRIVILNKLDLTDEEHEGLRDMRAYCKNHHIETFEISAAGHQGLKPLIWETRKRLDALAAPVLDGAP